MKRKIITVLIIGILIRLFLAFSTFHSDVQPFYFAGEVIAKGNFLNFYDYLRNLPVTAPILKIYPSNLFNYPPLVYFFLGPVSYLVSLPFSRYLLHNFIFNLPGLLGNLQLNFLLLTLKLPYLPFDIGISILLYKFFKDPKNKFLAFTIWMFNPVNLYATYMMGQFDVIPTFLAILALYLAVRKGKYFLASFFLGLGASFKIFPFLFLVPLALLQGKWFDRIKIVGIGVLTYIVSILPFINSPGFRGNALVAGQTTKSLYATLPISGGEAIIFFPVFILFFYILFFFLTTKLEDLWKRLFILILIFFIFTHTHPQWFVWLTPFLIIDLIKSRLKHWPLIALLLFVWLGQVSFFDPGLSIWLFSPLTPSLYGQVGIWKSLGINVDLNFARSILQTVFVSISAYYIYYYFPGRT
ncbi:MAG: glycosyltransferase family 87 protein, partial [Candidatus Woesebacteria bacterium]|nr:glycosyltransferase family 87 protein [Candidatus Woesebacteria bacterium]